MHTFPETDLKKKWRETGFVDVNSARGVTCHRAGNITTARKRIWTTRRRRQTVDPGLQAAVPRQGLCRQGALSLRGKENNYNPKFRCHGQK